jgi:hypothetical protein
LCRLRRRHATRHPRARSTNEPLGDLSNLTACAALRSGRRGRPRVTGRTRAAMRLASSPSHGSHGSPKAAEKRPVRRVLPAASFEPGSFEGWSTPRSFNEAAAGNVPVLPAPVDDHNEGPSAHAPGTVGQQESPAQRPPLAESVSASAKRPSSALSDGEPAPWDRLHQHSTRARATATVPTRPKEFAPLHARSRRFSNAGANVAVHSPARLGAPKRVSTRSPALLQNDGGEQEAASAWAWDRQNTAGSSARGSSAASQSSQRRLLSSADSSIPEDEVQLCAEGFGELLKKLMRNAIQRDNDDATVLATLPADLSRVYHTQ